MEATLPKPPTNCAPNIPEEEETSIPSAYPGVTPEDIHKKSIKELRLFLDDLGVDFSDCFEKSELVARAVEALDKL